MKLLEKVQITDENEGPIFDVATTCREELKLQSGTRMVAFRLMLKIATKHQEVENLMDDRYLKGLSPGIKRAVKNRMREAQAKLRREQQFCLNYFLMTLTTFTRDSLVM